MSTENLIWEEHFSTDEGWRRAPDIDLWRCKSCGHRSKHARNRADHLCMVCVSPGPEAPTVPKPVRKRRRARRARR